MLGSCNQQSNFWGFPGSPLPFFANVAELKSPLGQCISHHQPSSSSLSTNFLNNNGNHKMCYSNLSSTLPPGTSSNGTCSSGSNTSSITPPNSMTDFSRATTLNLTQFNYLNNPTFISQSSSPTKDDRMNTTWPPSMQTNWETK
ncbi:unnamed protein product, partial [Didymodactylos carnosus]